eukprot:802309-Prorocentrum_minimum.AAC.1
MAPDWCAEMCRLVEMAKSLASRSSARSPTAPTGSLSTASSNASSSSSAARSTFGTIQGDRRVSGGGQEGVRRG